MKKFNSIKPNMYRTLSNFFEDEKEFNDKIIKSGIVPPTEIVSGTEEITPVKGSLWTLDHRYAEKELFDPKSIHSILRKNFTIECKDNKMEVTNPNCCKIFDNEKEGVIVRCTCPIKIDGYDYIGNPPIYRGKRRF